MKLVIDANELFSAIISKGVGRQTKKLDILFSEKIKLFAPSLLFRELEKNETEIKSKSGFSDTDFNIFVGIIKLRIKSVSVSEFSKFLSKAKKISPHEKDIPYFAVALSLNCPIWSGEKRLKRQFKVKIFNTPELLEEFESLK